MRYKKHWDIKVELKPILLPVIAKAAGNSSPAYIPKKRVYIEKDLQRLARYFSVPLKMPADPLKSIEKGSLIPNRFLTATDMLYPEYLEGVSRALWMEMWNKDEDITAPAVLAQAGKVAGLSVEQLQKVQQHMTEQVTKDRLRACNDLAIECGGFGSPTIIAHAGGEPMMFFGSDRFPVMADEIGEKWIGPNPDAPEPKF